jgi:hypothetical protein
LAQRNKYFLVDGVMKSILVLFFISAMLFSCNGLSPSVDSSELDAVLKKHSGNILTPDESKAIIPKGLKIGYVYTLKYEYFNNKGVYSTEISSLRLSAIEDGAMIFDTIQSKYVDAKPRGGKIHNAIEFLLEDSGYSMYDSKGSACLFKIGVCETTRFNGNKDFIETKYKNGMWIKSAPAIGLQRRTEIYVFDKNGLLLYKLNQVGDSGTRITRIE